MKTKFKDVAGLYLGCQCKTPGGYFKMNGVYDDSTPVFYGTKKDYNWKEIKPFLHHISAIPVDILKKLFRTCYKSVYGSNPVKMKIEIVTYGDDQGLKSSEDGWEYGLTVNENGVMFSANGNFLNIPVFEVTKILLKGEVDLFNLIDNKQALIKE